MSVKDFATTKPTNRQQIAAWVQAFLGFPIHQTVRCTHDDPDANTPHQCQMDYIAGGFLNEYSSCVFMASRNAGKSYAAAIKCLLQAHFHARIKIAIAAFQRNQSDYIYTYMVEFLERFEKRVGVKIAKVTANEIQFRNGSIVRFFSGGKSQAGIKGFHPNVLVVDEGDLFSQEQFDGIANALEAGSDFARQFDVLSTNYTLSGEGIILKQIERLNEWNKTKVEHVLPGKVFRVCLLDILANCDDRFTCSTCPLFSYCRGKAKEGSGFYKIESALETMRDSSLQTFESQMLLLRPSSEHSYFHNFTVAHNITDPDRSLTPQWATFLCFDPGGSRCPHAGLVVQRDPDGCYWVIDEFLGMGLFEILLDTVLAKYPMATNWKVYFDPKGNAKDNTRGSTSYAGALRKAGFVARSRQMHRRPTFEQIFELISPAAGGARLKVNKRCKHLIEQIHRAEHKLLRGKPTPEPADLPPDDLLDCLRYIVGWSNGKKIYNTMSSNTDFEPIAGVGKQNKVLGRFF